MNQSWLEVAHFLVRIPNANYPVASSALARGPLPAWRAVSKAAGVCAGFCAAGGGKGRRGFSWRSSLAGAWEGIGATEEARQRGGARLGQRERARCAWDALGLAGDGANGRCLRFEKRKRSWLDRDKRPVDGGKRLRGADLRPTASTDGRVEGERPEQSAPQPVRRRNVQAGEQCRYFVKAQ